MSSAATIEAAKMMNVSPRMVEMAAVVRDRGIPELNDMVMAGELALSVAERAARWAKQDQSQICAMGAGWVRAVVLDARREAEAEQAEKLITRTVRKFAPGREQEIAELLRRLANELEAA